MYPGQYLAEVVVATGTKAVKPADPTRDGYDFAGWFIDGTDTAWNFDSVVTGDIILKAHWSEQEDETPAPDDGQETEEQKSETPAKEVRSPKTADRLMAYPFWIMLMAAGAAVSAGASLNRKKSGLKNQE